MSAAGHLRREETLALRTAARAEAPNVAPQRSRALQAFKLAIRWWLGSRTVAPNGGWSAAQPQPRRSRAEGWAGQLEPAAGLALPQALFVWRAIFVQPATIPVVAHQVDIRTRGEIVRLARPDVMNEWRPTRTLLANRGGNARKNRTPRSGLWCRAFEHESDGSQLGGAYQVVGLMQLGVNPVLHRIALANERSTLHDLGLKHLDLADEP